MFGHSGCHEVETKSTSTTLMQILPLCDHLGHMSIGARCSNQMQLAQGHQLNADLFLVLPALGFCIPLL